MTNPDCPHRSECLRLYIDTNPTGHYQKLRCDDCCDREAKAPITEAEVYGCAALVAAIFMGHRAMLLSPSEKLEMVIQYADGSEFQITIVKSK